jgi:hypothetical protein
MISTRCKRAQEEVITETASFFAVKDKFMIKINPYLGLGCQPSVASSELSVMK